MRHQHYNKNIIKTFIYVLIILNVEHADTLKFDRK